MSWEESIRAAFQNVWASVIQLLPEIITAIIVILIGWIVGALLARVVRRIASKLNANKALDYIGMKQVEERSGMKVDIPYFLGWIVKWFFIIVFLIAALDILELAQVNVFLQSVVFDFLPNLIVATLILVFGAVIAQAAERFAKTAAQSAGVASAGFMGTFARWAVWIFAILAAVYQIGIASALVQTLFAGLVFALSLALGLAFGLGGKEHASQYLSKMKNNLKS